MLDDGYAQTSIKNRREFAMKRLSLTTLWVVSLMAAIPAHAQWAVFDAANYGKAVAEYSELQQMYTTASQTRDQVIQAYNLAHSMSQMPQNLSQRYEAEFSQWTNLSAPNTYGNTSAWIKALNAGNSQEASAAYSQAIVQLSPYPSGDFSALDNATQATVKNQYATSELAQGVTTSALTALGQIRLHSESLSQQISNLETDSYSDDPAQQSEMAVLGKINAANIVQLHSQQDTNQLLSAAVEQQMLAQKQMVDAGNRTMNQAIYFQQNFPSNMQKITSGASQSLAGISFGTNGQ
jgi:hypothetical protein